MLVSRRMANTALRSARTFVEAVLSTIAVEIMHHMSQKSVEFLETYGYLIFVVPLENVTPEELTAMVEDLRAAREQELAELAA